MATLKTVKDTDAEFISTQMAIFTMEGGGNQEDMDTAFTIIRMGEGKAF